MSGCIKKMQFKRQYKENNGRYGKQQPFVREEINFVVSGWGDIQQIKLNQ